VQHAFYYFEKLREAGIT